MNIEKEVLAILDEILVLRGRSKGFDRDTPLLGALPELDSMAVIGLIGLIEERFGLVLEDDEIDGSIFASVGSLTDFIAGKLGR